MVRRGSMRRFQLYRLGIPSVKPAGRITINAQDATMGQPPCCTTRQLNDPAVIMGPFRPAKH